VEERSQNSIINAGIDAHICDKCIEQAHGIVLEINQAEVQINY
jgi:ATP-dependent Clp protease ATP-binding subunit ClpX